MTAKKVYQMAKLSAAIIPAVISVRAAIGEPISRLHATRNNGKAAAIN
jgi:hypothetical protein